MNLPGTRRVRLVCLCAFASWSALSPALGVLPSSRAALAADAACAVPAPVSLAVNAAASPVASPIASPVALATPVGSPVASEGALVGPATASAIEQVVRSVAACETAADYKTMAQLVTPNFLSHAYGGGSPLSAAQFVELGKSLPQERVTVTTVGDVRVSPDGGVSADVVLVQAKQIKHARWSFVATPSSAGDSTGGETGQSLGGWQVNDVTPLPVAVAADAQSFAVTITGKGFSPASIAAKKGSDLVFNASNQDKQDHELLVLRLGKGMTTEDLLLATGPALPKGVAFIGQVTIPAGTEGQLVLTGMPRDSYVIVDMLPDADGVPFLSGGFQMTLTVS